MLVFMKFYDAKSYIHAVETRFWRDSEGTRAGTRDFACLSMHEGVYRRPDSYHWLVEGALHENLHREFFTNVKYSQRDRNIVYLNKIRACPCCGSLLADGSDTWADDFINDIIKTDRLVLANYSSIIPQSLEWWLKLCCLHKSLIPSSGRSIIVGRCENCKKHNLFKCIEDAYTSQFPSKNAEYEEFLKLKMWQKYDKKGVSKKQIKKAAHRWARRHKNKITGSTRTFFQLMLGASKLNKAIGDKTK